MKRLIGALYGILLEKPLNSLYNWKCRFEKEYLRYCRTGCKDCYKWNAYCRSENEGTPYKKFRKKYHRGCE
ncbi:MAG: hypothetical protein K2N34_01620 [Lachnospiraceae bacterium]|nr:hypothetical protein [Lachnospiraceae bacterium]MDE7430611.1 hypothetical protein [Lachnospiraceae bacterium]